MNLRQNIWLENDDKWCQAIPIVCPRCALKNSFIIEIILMLRLGVRSCSPCRQIWDSCFQKLDGSVSDQIKIIHRYTSETWLVDGQPAVVVFTHLNTVAALVLDYSRKYNSNFSALDPSPSFKLQRQTLKKRKKIIIINKADETVSSLNYYYHWLSVALDF